MDNVTNWTSGKNYLTGSRVIHEGKVYEKLDDDDQSPPDDIGGGWRLLNVEGVEHYQSIASVLDSYEERVQQHQARLAAAKASAEAKLTALGLTVEELQAIGL